jgi:hypothetical protein
MGAALGNNQYKGLSILIQKKKKKKKNKGISIYK